ncbi:MAG TPA: class I SAM-dependent methyltransferase [bacterium]|nr:class I SAM-dependent methyltransferase [bacterium]HQI49077.1 class I SAM-dependent methyltransferase [bacterium]HQJ63278.1 class I SAM-dependent methyltransferase [bacterium]
MLSGDLSGKEKYWLYQYRLGSQYLLPLLMEWGVPLEGARMLDIGCAEAGILCAFAEAGGRAIGLELSPSRLHFARHFASPAQQARMTLIAADFFHMPLRKEQGRFDLILLRDVFEHLPDKNSAFAALAALMQPGTRLILTFPPFYSPFGGHQQMLGGFLRRIPWFHILPQALWRLIARYIVAHDPNPRFLEEMEKLRHHRMSIALCHRLAKKYQLTVSGERYYLSRPSYQLRYGWPVIGAQTLGHIPVLREFLITGALIMMSRPCPES